MNHLAEQLGDGLQRLGLGLGRQPVHILNMSADLCDHYKLSAQDFVKTWSAFVRMTNTLEMTENSLEAFEKEMLSKPVSKSTTPPMFQPTLTKFLQMEEDKWSKLLPEAREDLSLLLFTIQAALKAISSEVRRNALLGGKCCIKEGLDELAQNHFINMIYSSFPMCAEIQTLGASTSLFQISGKGPDKFYLCMDALNGTSGIDASGMGSIFGIYKKLLLQPTQSDAKQGRQLLAAGYALYGNVTTLVLTVGQEVKEFTLHPAIEEFTMTVPNVKVAGRAKIYCVNEGYTNCWGPEVKQYVEYLKSSQPIDKLYVPRFAGSMIADFHRTLTYGGIFMSPARKGAPDGKCRLLYDANPMAFIMEKAGGLASNGTIPILDIQLRKTSDCCPIFMGSGGEVKDALAAINNKQNGSNPLKRKHSAVSKMIH